MFGEESRRENYISDAEKHNPWWSPSYLSKDSFDGVTDYPPRSDFYVALSNFEDYADSRDANIYPIYGQTGIGKTTLIKQLIAGLIDDAYFDYSPGHDEESLLQTMDPRQIIYIPLEESLYDLEAPAQAIDQLGNVLDYFRTHIAPRGEQVFIFLDDIGALRLNSESKSMFLQQFEPNSVVFLAGNIESQVNFSSTPPGSPTNIEEDPFPMLTMKFIDTLKQGIYESINDVQVRISGDLKDRIRAHQSQPNDEGAELIKEARLSLGDRDIDGFIRALRELYFEELSRSERDDLHEAAEIYLRHGGILYKTENTLVRNELVKSRFLLYLYKELARVERIQQPENLHRLSSIAATQAGKEIQYTKLAEQIGVDRRTVNSYLDTLEAGKAVSEANEYSIRQHRRTRLYLRNPRHLVTLSQKQEHFGFEEFSSRDQINHEFQYKLARSVIYDHARRLAWKMPKGPTEPGTVEYENTGEGVVDYILQGDGLVLPFSLSYHPYTNDNVDPLIAFNPSAGNHADKSGEGVNLDYNCPARFILTDSFPRKLEENDRFRMEKEGTNLYYLPYWLFLLIS